MNVDGLVVAEAEHVYPVREDTLLLASSVSVARGERVLEVGCGLGLASLAAARQGAHVVSTDLNPFAVAALRRACSRNSIQLECVETNLMDGTREFDLILFNPPYLPTSPEEKDPDPWQDIAINGGPDGQEVLRGFLTDLPDHLCDSGRAYVVAARVGGWDDLALKEMRSHRELVMHMVVSEQRFPGESLSVVQLSREVRQPLEQ